MSSPILTSKPVKHARWWLKRDEAIAAGALIAIVVHLMLRYGRGSSEVVAATPLWVALTLGGAPLVFELTLGLLQRRFGSDLLAGLSIVVSVILGEYLAGTLVVLMLSGGQALEAYAVRSASSVLNALARRMPQTAHRKSADGLEDVALDQVAVGDLLVVFPHEICPVDGVVVEGHGAMDEAYLTGEPYRIAKAVGSDVLSGAINGASALEIRAGKAARDSRYAKIMQVMRESEQSRPRLRRLGDQLGAWYTPLAVVIATVAWLGSGDPVRFLAVLVVATPCPLLIGIPVAIIGAISLSARRGIVVKNPVVLEQLSKCRTMIFDKTGTLTYGEPRLTQEFVAAGHDSAAVLRLVASLEQYSKHPLAAAILLAAEGRHLALLGASQVNEPPGAGMQGVVDGHRIRVTSRKKLAEFADLQTQLPPSAGGLECVVLVDGGYAATYQFRDQPRREGASFVQHLGPRHQFGRIMLVSGDRESEVRYLAEAVGINEIFASQSPEEKLAIVRAETARVPTVYLGDGINDAPALTAATVGLAMGTASDVTSEAADAVILESSLKKVDEFMHITQRMRRIVLETALGGMALSLLGMGAAAAGYLPPVAGALLQEAIDVVAIVNALRAAVPPRSLVDF
ncbi:MAG: cadmium-translocating P-type ATPase [Pirellulales bacterium]|nr:cadmium-translocating P-type ATPase [Pirellulales bacterium]